MSYLCEYCGKNFTRKTNLNRHSERQHNGIQFSYTCTICRKNFSNRDHYNRHISKHLKNEEWFLFRSAFSGSTKIYRKKLENTTNFLQLLLLKKDLQKLIKKELMKYPKLKLNISVVAEYTLDNGENILNGNEEFVLKSNNYLVTANQDKELETQIITCINQLRVREDQLNLNQSGWTLNDILYIDVHLTQVNILL